MPNKKEIEVIVRALILKGNKILLCKAEEDRHYFLPGGHLEFGESAASALSRELKEELGVKSETGSLIGICEHIYRNKGKKHHEINLIFKVGVGKIDLQGKEKKLNFYLKDLKEFKKIYFLPEDLKGVLINYFKNKKFFWRNF
jgi:ADP-ribose pyrophosphatase YjhB (NUDIX family)